MPSLPSLILGPANRQGHEKLVYRLNHSDCSSPRKSLVKGERFIRAEGKPELLYNSGTRCFSVQDATKRVATLNS